MKYTWPLLFLVLSACLTGRRHVPHAPPERAARVVFPAEVPPEGRIIVQGNKVAAMMLALDAFLPQESVDSCLHQRASYGVSVAQGPEGELLVRVVADEAGARGGPSCGGWPMRRAPGPAESPWMPRLRHRSWIPRRTPWISERGGFSPSKGIGGLAHEVPASAPALNSRLCECLRDSSCSGGARLVVQVSKTFSRGGAAVHSRFPGRRYFLGDGGLSS